MVCLYLFRGSYCFFFFCESLIGIWSIFYRIPVGFFWGSFILKMYVILQYLGQNMQRDTHVDFIIQVVTGLQGPSRVTATFLPPSKKHAGRWIAIVIAWHPIQGVFLPHVQCSWDRIRVQPCP